MDHFQWLCNKLPEGLFPLLSHQKPCNPRTTARETSTSGGLPNGRPLLPDSPSHDKWGRVDLWDNFCSIGFLGDLLGIYWDFMPI